MIMYHLIISVTLHRKRIERNDWRKEAQPRTSCRSKVVDRVLKWSIKNQRKLFAIFLIGIIGFIVISITIFINYMTTDFQQYINKTPKMVIEMLVFMSALLIGVGLTIIILSSIEVSYIVFPKKQTLSQDGNRENK